MMKLMYYAIELNLLLWLCVCGMLTAGDVDPSDVKIVAWVGFALAAIGQHWAYYNLRKRRNEHASELASAS